MVGQEGPVIGAKYSINAESGYKIIVSVIPDKGYKETAYKFEYWSECSSQFALSGFFAKFQESK